MELDDRDKAILALERQWFQYVGTKEQIIREQFGVSTTSYYLELVRLLRDPAAMAHDPFTVKRLLRIAGDRRSVRASRPLGDRV